MNLEQELKKYGKAHTPIIQEVHMEETIQKSMAMLSEKEEKLSYREFFWIQLKMIQKRWWLLQILILMGMWEMLFLSKASDTTQRGMSIGAALFVVLIIPELWKNRESGSLEIEAAAFYSLKQVYAVRLIAFGLMDIFMLTIFCAATTATQAISVIDLLKQLVFPMVVVAAICFAILGSENHFRQVVAIIGCLMTSGLWTLIVSNEMIYAAITPVIWVGLFTIAIVVLIVSVRKILGNCDRCWEVKLDGIEIE